MTSPEQVIVMPLQPVPLVEVTEQFAANLAQTFETLSKNVSSLPFVIQRDMDGHLSSVVYGDGLLIKTLQRDESGRLSAVVLSGKALGLRRLTKRLARMEGVGLNEVSYQTSEGATP